MPRVSYYSTAITGNPLLKILDSPLHSLHTITSVSKTDICMTMIICDWIYGNWSKLHIGIYKIMISKHYNQPRIVSTRIKLTQKVEHFTVFKRFPSNICCSQKFPPNNLEKIG